MSDSQRALEEAIAEFLHANYEHPERRDLLDDDAEKLAWIVSGLGRERDGEDGIGHPEAREQAVRACVALVDHFCYARSGLTEVVAEAWARSTAKKQPPPNENWCVGCSPDPDLAPGTTACPGCPPVYAEPPEVREALRNLCGWAEEARGHYGIEECAGPTQPATEWDEIQDGLAQAARDGRAALAPGSGQAEEGQ